jgi:AraC-like DNA-binding protein
MKSDAQNAPIRPHGFAGERHIVLSARDAALSARRSVLGDLLVTAAGHFPHAAGHLVTRPNGAPEWILLFCVDGSGWCRFGRRHWRLRAGQAIVVPHGTPHAYGTTKRKPWSLYWLHAAGTQVPALFSLAQMTPREPILSCGRPAEVAFHFEDLLGLMAYGGAAAYRFAQAAAFATILSRLNLHRVTDRSGAWTTAERVRATVTHMRERLSVQVTVAELARAAGLSPSHYAALFRQLLGQSPLAFFHRLKVGEACRALATTDEPVRAIAARLGFEDPLYFSRLFRKVQGVPPSAYRDGFRVTDRRTSGIMTR